uniref:Uncharacterized protein n=1 Tax=Leersia perrieri TaxID=77586 RepID=A0A0D9V8K3_9ORYZ
MRRPPARPSWVADEDVRRGGLQRGLSQRQHLAEILSPSTEHCFRAARHDEADHLLRHVYLLAHYDDGTDAAVVDVRHVARHFCSNVIRRLTFGRRHFRQPKPEDGAPGRDEAEHMDALFAALNYLDEFCVSDYFPAVVGLDLDGH